MPCRVIATGPRASAPTAFLRQCGLEEMVVLLLYRRYRGARILDGFSIGIVKKRAQELMRLAAQRTGQRKASAVMDAS